MVALALETSRSSRIGSDEVSARQLELVRLGDRTACETFIHQHAPQLLAVARRYLRCEHDAADAVQDAFVSALRGLAGFEGGSSLSTWLHRITVNVCLMKLRSKARRRVVAIEDLSPAIDDEGRRIEAVSAWRTQSESSTTSDEVRAGVRACVENLPDDYREVLILRDVEELDTETTADILGISSANVKVRLHRARQALRKLLTPMMAGRFEELAA